MDGSSWEILHCFQFWHSDTVIMENSGTIFRLHLFSPLYYFVPHWVSTEMLFLCVPRQLSRGAVVLSGEEICCTGRLGWAWRLEQDFPPKGSQGNWVSAQKKAARAGGAATDTQTQAVLGEKSNHAPQEVPGKWWRDLSAWTRPGDLHLWGKAAQRQQGETSKSSTQCLKDVSCGVTDGARCNVGQENSCLFSHMSKGQQGTSWCPCLLCPLLPASQNLSRDPGCRREPGDWPETNYLARQLLPDQLGWVLRLTDRLQTAHLPLWPLHNLLQPAQRLGKQNKLRVQVRCSPVWPKGLSEPLLSRGLCLEPSQ